MAQSKRVATLEEIISLAQQLSPIEKVRLIERIAPEIEREMLNIQPRPGTSLLGLLKDFGPAPSEDEIDDARREAWGVFPREVR